MASAETAQQRRHKQLREQARTPHRRRVTPQASHQQQYSMDLDAVLAACTSNDNTVRKQAEQTITAASKSPEILSQLMQRLQGGEPQVVHCTTRRIKAELIAKNSPSGCGAVHVQTAIALLLLACTLNSARSVTQCLRCMEATLHSRTGSIAFIAAASISSPRAKSSTWGLYLQADKGHRQGLTEDAFNCKL